VPNVYSLDGVNFGYFSARYDPIIIANDPPVEWPAIMIG
jgi:hypothetical protein